MPDRITRDEPGPGLVVFQPARGFRYAMEPFLLTAWALEGGVPRETADLCCGSGIVALLLVRRGIGCIGYDVRPEWVDLARRSALASGLDVDFVLQDIRQLPPGDLDLALMNPPYNPLGSGFVSPDPWKAAARHEMNGSLRELVAAGAGVARRLAMIMGQGRLAECRMAMSESGLVISRVCLLDDALAMLEGCRSHDGPEVEERVEMRHDGHWSARVRDWYESLGAGLEGK